MGAWQTFKGWHRDHEFWQVVWAQALGGLIAAFIVLVIAIITGYVKVHGRQIVGVGGVVLFALGILATDALFFRLGAETGRRWGYNTRRMRLVVFLLVVALGAAVFFGTRAIQSAVR